MTDLQGRINRLMPTLTAKERGVLILRSLKYKTPEDPSWRSMMPPAQARDLNHYIGLMNAANIQLASLITVLERTVNELELRQAWYYTIWLWSRQLDQIGSLLPPCPTGPPEEDSEDEALTLLYQVIETWPLGEGGLGEMAESVKSGLVRGIMDRWEDIRVTEAVLEEIAADFDNEDPLKPQTRKALDESKQHLLRMRDELKEYGEEIELLPPSEEATDEIRAFVRKAHVLFAK